MTNPLYLRVVFLLFVDKLISLFKSDIYIIYLLFGVKVDQIRRKRGNMVNNLGGDIKKGVATGNSFFDIEE